MDKVLKMIKKHKWKILIGICTAFLILYIIIAFNLNTTSFKDRILGSSAMMNYDVTQRLYFFYASICIAIPLLIFLLFNLWKYLMNKMDKEWQKFLNLFLCIGIINCVLFVLATLYNMTIKIWDSLYILSFIIIFSTGLYLYKDRKKEKLNVEIVKWTCIAAIPLSFVLSTLGYKLFNIHNYWIFYILSFICLYLLSNWNHLKLKAFQKSYIFIIIAPILESIFLELYSILNQYNIFISHKMLIIVSIYFICGLLTLIHYIFVSKKKEYDKFDYKKIYYPLIVISFGLILAALPTVSTINAEFFESANKGLSIYEFLKYGKIPLLESYNAHMINMDIFDIIFGIVNKDYLGASLIGYAQYQMVLFYLLMYFVFAKLFSKETSILIVLFFPLLYDSGLYYFGWALLSILTLLNALKKKTYSSYLWYFLSLALLCLWRLDVGFAASMASVTILILLTIKNHTKSNLKNILLSFITVIGGFLLLYLGLCLWKNINPISRALEFLKLTLSDKNWNYYYIGDPKYYKFFICYLLIPIAVVISLGYSIYKLWKEKDFTPFKIITIFLGLIYIFNIPRALGRHSLAENCISIVLSTSLIYFTLYYFQYHKNIYKFLGIFVTLIIGSNLILTPETKLMDNLTDNILNKYTSFAIQTENYQEKVDRVVISDEMKNEYKDLNECLSALLKDGETYLDFANQTMLYALMDFEKPVYVNQSPGLLSGEFTQEKYIEEIEEHNVPIVIKANDKQLSNYLDEVPNDYRYYLISEYINQNYTPSLVVNGYEIWLKNNELSRLKNVASLNNPNISNYVDDDALEYNVIYLPYIWGMYDTTVKKEQLNLAKDLGKTLNTSIAFETLNLDTSSGNYLQFRIDSQIDSHAIIHLTNEYNQDLIIHFNLIKGENVYIIRISSFYKWYEGIKKTLQLTLDSESNVHIISVLKGDRL